MFYYCIDFGLYCMYSTHTHTHIHIHTHIDEVIALLECVCVGGVFRGRDTVQESRPLPVLLHRKYQPEASEAGCRFAYKRTHTHTHTSTQSKHQHAHTQAAGSIQQSFVCTVAASHKHQNTYTHMQRTPSDLHTQTHKHCTHKYTHTDTHTETPIRWEYCWILPLLTPVRLLLGKRKYILV